MIEKCEDYDRPKYHKSAKPSSEQLQMKKYFHQQQMKRQIVSSATGNHPTRALLWHGWGVLGMAENGFVILT